MERFEGTGRELERVSTATGFISLNSTLALDFRARSAILPLTRLAPLRKYGRVLAAAPQIASVAWSRRRTNTPSPLFYPLSERTLEVKTYDWLAQCQGIFSDRSETEMLWFWYHERTETYDQSVCRMRDFHRVARPETREERRLCSLNAMHCRRIQLRAAAILGLSDPLARQPNGDCRDDLEYLRQQLQHMTPKVKEALDLAESQLASTQPRLPSL